MKVTMKDIACDIHCSMPRAIFVRTSKEYELYFNNKEYPPRYTGSQAENGKQRKEKEFSQTGGQYAFNSPELGFV